MIPAQIKRGVFAVAIAVLPAWVPARIDLVTLPPADQTQLTIYASEDLTLVHETRTLMFQPGENKIQFSWSNALIDPASLHLRLPVPQAGLSVLDTQYPENSTNTVVWTVEAEKPAPAPVEIRYFAAGIDWDASYRIVTNEDESEFRLEPDFTITNNSGEDIENARTRLVVGEVNLVEEIRDLAIRALDSLVGGALFRDGRLGLMDAPIEAMEMERDGDDDVSFATGHGGGRGAGWKENRLQAKAKEIVKTALSEYYLYTIEGTEDIGNGWAKQLPNPRIEGIPLEVRYEYDTEKFGPRLVKLYRFRNDSEHKLGAVPLPGGTYFAYGSDGRGGLRFWGTNEHKYLPIGEEAELNLGNDGLVIYELKPQGSERLNFEFDTHGDVAGHDRRDRYTLEIRNSHSRPVPVKLRERFGNYDWEVVESSGAVKNIDRFTIEWEGDVPANGKKEVEVTLLVRLGKHCRVPDAPADVPMPTGHP